MLESLDDKFGTFRAILQGMASEGSWESLHEILLEAWLRAPELVEEQWLPYQRALAARWPARTRALSFWLSEMMLEASATHLMAQSAWVDVCGMGAFDQLRERESTPRVRALALDHEELTTWSASILGYHALLAELTRFSYHHVHSSPKAWIKLIEADFFATLHALEIENVTMERQRTYELRQAMSQIDLGHLTSLTLDTAETNPYAGGYQILPEGLLGATSFSRLHTLTMRNGTLTPNMAAHIAHGVCGESLTSLTLTRFRLGQESMRQLSDATWPLERLVFDQVALHPDDFDLLIESPWLKNLTSLTLRQCHIKGWDMERLLDAVGYELCELVLDANSVGSEQLIALSNHVALGKLERLSFERRFGVHDVEVYDAYATSRSLPEATRAHFEARAVALRENQSPSQ